MQRRRTTNGGALALERRHARRGIERRARALGWFSLGLGAVELLMPRRVANLIGAPDDEHTKRTLVGVGLREIASGVGILTRAQPAGWLWSRVAGDVIDLALLGAARTSPDSDARKLSIATAAVAGVTLLDAVSAVELGRDGNGSSNGRVHAAPLVQKRGIHVVKSITVNREPEQVYLFWRNFENLPRFMAHLESVVVAGERSRWRAKGPAGTTVEWEAEIVLDQPNQTIVWRSTEDADVENEGSVRFVPAAGGHGTEIRVELRYRPPAGIVGATIAKLFGREPSQQIAGDLRRFKQVLETGEVLHSDASIHPLPHSARPPKRLPKTVEDQRRQVV
jgi:uncharacterized membrane protein